MPQPPEPPPWTATGTGTGTGTGSEPSGTSLTDHGSVLRTPESSTGDRYELRQELGRGGMGVVWRAWDRVLGRTVALKQVRPDRLDARRRARFLREARATARLNHPAIVPLYDFGLLPDGSPFYTMKEIDGDSLEQAIFADIDGGRAAPERGVEALARAAEALAAAHAQGLVHRDLKPANIMLGHHGELYVVDWGLVRGGPEQEEAPQEGEAAAAPALTQDGSVLGTRGYMAPEQAAGRHEELGPPADVYALGGTLLFALTGAHPRADPAPQLAAVADPSLRRLVRAALHPDPAQRPDMADLAAALGDWLRGVRAEARSAAQQARAEAAWQDLPPGTEARARELLLRLVDGEGRPVPTAADPAWDAVIGPLESGGLVRRDGAQLHLGTPELAAWPRLQSWREVDPAGHQLRGRLAAAARAWSEGGRPDGSLWRGAQLAAAREGLTGAPLVPGTERAFLDRSAAVERREQRRRRAGIGLAAGAVAGLAALAAGIQHRSTQSLEVAEERVATAEEQAQARQYLAQAALAGSEGRHFAEDALIDAALAINRAVPGAEERRAELQATLGQLRVHPLHRGQVWRVVLDPSGATAVTAGNDGQAVHLDLDSGAVLGRLAHDSSLHWVDLAPGGSPAVFADDTGQLVVWDLETHGSPRRIRVGESQVQMVELSPDGRAAAWSTSEGACGTVLLATGAVTTAVEGRGRGSGVAWSPDGRRFACAQDAGGLVVVDAATGSARWTAVEGRAYLPLWVDENTVIAGNIKQDQPPLIRWRPGERPEGLGPPLPARLSWVERAGDRVRLSALGGWVRQVDLHTGETDWERQLHEGAAWWTCPLPGERLVSVGGDGAAVVVDAATGTPLEHLHHEAGLRAVACHPDRPGVLAASLAGALLHWVPRVAHARRLLGPGSRLLGQWDLRGQRALVGSAEGLAEVQAGAVPALVPLPESAGTRDGGSDPRTGRSWARVGDALRVWDAADQPPRELPLPPGVERVFFAGAAHAVVWLGGPSRLAWLDAEGAVTATVPLSGRPTRRGPSSGAVVERLGDVFRVVHVDGPTPRVESPDPLPLSVHPLVHPTTGTRYVPGLQGQVHRRSSAGTEQALGSLAGKINGLGLDADDTRLLLLGRDGATEGWTLDPAPAPTGFAVQLSAPAIQGHWVAGWGWFLRGQSELLELRDGTSGRVRVRPGPTLLAATTTGQALATGDLLVEAPPVGTLLWPADPPVPPGSNLRVCAGPGTVVADTTPPPFASAAACTATETDRNRQGAGGR